MWGKWEDGHYQYHRNQPMDGHYCELIYPYMEGSMTRRTRDCIASETATRLRKGKNKTGKTSSQLLWHTNHHDADNMRTFVDIVIFRRGEPPSRGRTEDVIHVIYSPKAWETAAPTSMGPESRCTAHGRPRDLCLRRGERTIEAIPSSNHRYRNWQMIIIMLPSPPEEKSNYLGTASGCSVRRTPNTAARERKARKGVAKSHSTLIYFIFSPCHQLLCLC